MNIPILIMMLCTESGGRMERMLPGMVPSAPQSSVTHPLSFSKSITNRMPTAT